MKRPEAPELHHEQVFVRTALGASEAANVDSKLASELRHLLILIDGRSTLAELSSRYPAEALHAAIVALWQGGYVQVLHDPRSPEGGRKEGGLWSRLVDTLSRTQPIPVYRPDQPSPKAAQPGEGGSAKHGLTARFTASGKFWFSQGGRQLDSARDEPPAGHRPSSPIGAQVAAEAIDPAADKPALPPAPIK